MGHTNAEQNVSLAAFTARCRDRGYHPIGLAHCINRYRHLRQQTSGPLDDNAVKDASSQLYRLWRWLGSSDADELASDYPAVYFPLWRARFKLLYAMKRIDNGTVTGPASYKQMRRTAGEKCNTPSLQFRLWILDHR